MAGQLAIGANILSMALCRYPTHASALNAAAEQILEEKELPTFGYLVPPGDLALLYVGSGQLDPNEWNARAQALVEQDRARRQARP